MFGRFLLPLLAASTFALPSPQSDDSTTTSTCSGNNADDRSIWCDYDLSTDYYSTVPDTGVTREYWLEITNVTAAPDGVERIVLAVNGTVPGPQITADWGDWVTIHVTNSLTNNGTGIHWHGIRQNYTNEMDGVPSISQCAGAPGSTQTYTWRATQYGSTWYHSHYSLQAWEGVFGPIIINGPATANYDEDLGHVMLVDWSHTTADGLYSHAQSVGPPDLDTGLINGTNTYTSDDGTTTGLRFKTVWTSGTSYRIRLTNAAIDTYFKFSIDNHTMTVIANDLVPIVPYTTDVLDMAMGQRYDVVVAADQGSGDFWMRAIPQSACSENLNPDDIKGIVRYDSSSTSDPTSTAYDYTDECVDEDISDLVPYLSQTVGSASTDADDLNVAVSKNTADLFKWTLGTTSMAVEWDDPTVLQIINNATTFETSDNVISLDADTWVYYIIETTLPVPHPIHLHGHDFYVLAQAADSTYSSSVTLNLDNPPRRDTATLPSSGYVVIAFYTDNPGAWLMHCHIGWHTSEGLAMQFVERQSEIVATLDTAQIEDQCSAWSTYQTSAGLEEEDSGV